MTVQQRCTRIILAACILLQWLSFPVAGQAPITNTSSSDTGSSEYPYCRGDEAAIQDGVCQLENNNAACGYDGGDCCKCTCVDGPDFACGEVGVGFFCLDPSAECVDATTAPTPSPFSIYDFPDCGGYIYDIHDGWCDLINNNEDCGYDGGDCCECTCNPDLYFSCDQNDDDTVFVCRDPEAECFESTPSATPTSSPLALYSPECEGLVSELGDGKCDTYNNNEACGYDGGDCCECTCSPGKYYDCDIDDDYYGYPFQCLDPNAGCGGTPSPAFSTYPNCTAGYILQIGDGYCTAANNNEECGYDGGDCCECTCVGGDDDYACGGYYFYSSTSFDDCIDPEAGCAPTPSPTGASLSECSGIVAQIGDGFCDSANNNADCEYDGGDCCECTCIPGERYSCNDYDDDYVVFDCVDPEVDCPPSPAPTIIGTRTPVSMEPTAPPLTRTGGTPSPAAIGSASTEPTDSQSSLSVGRAIGFVSLGGVALCCVGGMFASLFYAARGRQAGDKRSSGATRGGVTAPPEPTSAPPGTSGSLPEPAPSSAEPSGPVNDVKGSDDEGEIKVPLP